MKSEATIKKRLQRLDLNLNELQRIHQEWSKEQIENDTVKQWALRYGLFESIQIIIDTACNVVSERNLGTPNTYLDCLSLLLKFKYIDQELFSQLKPIIGLRNILIHDYIKIDIEKLFQDLYNLKPFYTYIEQLIPKL